MAISTASGTVSSRSSACVSSTLSLTGGSTLCELVVKVAIRNRQAHTVERRTRDRPGQELAAHGRQHSIGQNRVDHAAAALHFRAPADDELHRVFVVGERNLVVLAHAP